MGCLTDVVAPSLYGWGMRRLFVAALASCIVVACSPRVLLDVQAPATFQAEPGGFAEALVERVVDGDTIEVRITTTTDGPGAGRVAVGERYDVRLLGIDTPESVNPSSPVECFGKESAAATDALLSGASVRLVKDVEEVDGFGRLLRYVYMGDEMANARLVTNGYAFAYTYPPNVRHSGLFVALQREARETNRGLWHPEACNGAP